MKINIMGLLHNIAMDMPRQNNGYAFALLELANNLRLVMRHEATLEQFGECYVGTDRAPFDIDKLLPHCAPDEAQAAAPVSP